MQKGGGEGVQIACKIAYVLNGRPLGFTFCNRKGKNTRGNWDGFISKGLMRMRRALQTCTT